jgi:hypothetical protein
MSPKPAAETPSCRGRRGASSKFTAKPTVFWTGQPRAMTGTQTNPQLKQERRWAENRMARVNRQVIL